MNSSNQILSKMLDDYLKPDSIEGAFLIKGKWGTGKTYFIRKYIEAKEKLQETVIPQEKDQRKYIYVSLNGVSTLNEINNSIFYQIHPNIEKIKKNKFAHVLIELFKIAARSNPHLSIDFEKVNLEGFTEIQKEIILILDDLERCQIDIIKLLGYINQFVEDKNFKVIVIGNDDEIKHFKNKDNLNLERISAAILSLNKNYNSSPDNSYQNCLNNSYSKSQFSLNQTECKKILNTIIEDFEEIDYYSVIKEKVFSLEYEYKFDSDIVYECLKEHCDKYSIQKQELIFLIESLNCKNLRSFLLAKHFIEEYIKCDVNFMRYDETIKKQIIFNIIIEVVVFKNPRLLKNPISYSSDIMLFKEHWQNVFSKKYKYYLFRYIHHFIQFGSIEPKEIQNTIANYEKMMRDEDCVSDYPSLKILNSQIVYEFEEENFIDAISNLYEDIYNNKIPLKFYFKCFNHFFCYEKILGYKDDKINCNTFMELLNQNLNQEKDFVSYDNHETVFEENREKKDWYLKIVAAFDSHNLLIKEQKINENIKNPAISLILSDYDQTAYSAKTFLGLFNFDELCSSIRTFNNAKLREFCIIMREIYQISNICEYFITDIERIDKLIEFMKSEINEKKNIRNKILQSSIEFLNERLVVLSSYVERQTVNN